ncbi:DUF397 domain-containing protein [Nocardiopsis dassonvillei]|uniref:DUF397 domain-containing protein n=1 Tax=Nocardiopsis dassonvillei TaxID=2014 RepID=UPI00157DB388|nr:DUF397 domain-containing protein [Nocardiopsis dassonvillei]
MNPEWTTSTYSPNGGDCIEARGVEGGAEVRDSKNREAATLSLSSSEWVALTRTVGHER